MHLIKYKLSSFDGWMPELWGKLAPQSLCSNCENVVASQLLPISQVSWGKTKTFKTKEF